MRFNCLLHIGTWCTQKKKTLKFVIGFSFELEEGRDVVSLRIEGLRDGHAQERRREETRGRNVKYQRESENKRSDVIFRLNLTVGYIRLCGESC